MIKERVIYVIVIGLIVGAAMFIYKESLSFEEVIASVIAYGGAIGWIFNWLTGKEKKAYEVELKKVRNEKASLQMYKDVAEAKRK